MNEITAFEVALTKDTVAIEQSMQGLTMTAVPTVSQAITPAATPKAQAKSTLKQQNEEKKDELYKGKNKWATNNNPGCYFCNTEDHYSGNFPKVTTPQQKRSALAKLNKCQEYPEHIKKI